MKQITITLPDDIFNTLRLTSIHRHEDIDAIIVRMIQDYYESRKDD